MKPNHLITPSGLAQLKEKRRALEQRLVETQQKDRGGTTSWGGSFEKERLQNELYLINEQLDQINEQIENSVVVQEALISQNKPTVIDFGSKALLIINTEEVTYTFLGEAEADPAKGIISITSPLGSALKGKKPGDVVTVPIASGTLTVTVFELLDVQE